jgi:hypothetical protein
MANRLLHIARALPAAAFIALSAATCQRPSAAPATPPPAPAPPAADGAQTGIAGAWVHREMPVRYLESMTLRQDGERVTGEGTYMMEGGRGGKTTITGTWRGGALRLDLTRDSGVKERWVGRLEGDRLTGTLTIDGSDQAFSFERQTGT